MATERDAVASVPDEVLDWWHKDRVFHRQRECWHANNRVYADAADDEHVQVFHCAPFLRP
jgi:hypothetical protein